MKCALTRWWMEEYIDGTLDEKRERWIRTHLQRCQACAQELAWRRSLRDSLRADLSSTPCPQQMWEDFQRRLSERRQPAHTSRVAWWQWSAATAAVACALVLGIAWWGSYTPVSERPRGQNFASSERHAGTLAAPGAESPVYSLSTPTRSPAVKPVRTAKAPPVKSNEPPPLSMRLAARATAQPAEPVVQPAPQAYASVAYAEVRNEQGELVSRLLLQTTYDQNGQPRSVQIEYDASAAVEVENDDNPMDSSDTHDNSRGSAGSPTAAADSGTRLSD